MASSLTAEQHLTAQRELLDMLSFNLDDGRIWLSGKRMMLLDVASFGALRDELISRLGIHTARTVLTRIGYASGNGDADLIRKRWPTDYALHAPIGAQIHQLEGVARIEAKRVDWDPARKHFEAEYLWHHSIEDDAEITSHGLGSEPTCWMEIGYATGYVSRISDRLTIFREIECRSMGTAACRVIAKPADAWDDIAEDLEYLGIAPRQHTGARKRTPGLRTEPALKTTGLAAVHGLKSLGRPIVGRSAALSAALSLLARVASTRATVLVTGESGVGKELFARALHELSPRRTGPFVAVNCAAIPETLIEAELFGVERGAFTGANASRPGRFERADGGTLFLDEIATLSSVAQTKLLRALQEGEVERVGGVKVLKPDVRVVAAANINLRKAVQDGHFREDLYFRLNVFPIELPPLRERRDDIPILVDHFLGIYCKTHGREAKQLTPRALQLLLQHRYPGNIRELERIIERAVILAEGETIDVAHIQTPGEPALDPALLFVSNSGSLRRESHATGANENTAIQALAAELVSQCEAGESPRIDAVADELLTSVTRIAAARCGGNLAAAARLVGLKRHQLEYRLKRAEP